MGAAALRCGPLPLLILMIPKDKKYRQKWDKILVCRFDRVISKR